MKNYFENCNSLDEAKTIYRQYSKKLHPDMGGSEADFIELNRQYKEYLGVTVQDQAQAETVFSQEVEEMIDWLIEKSKTIPALRFVMLLTGEPIIREKIRSMLKRYGLHVGA